MLKQRNKVRQRYPTAADASTGGDAKTIPWLRPELSTGRSPSSVHRAPADRHQFGMDLDNGGELASLISFVEKRPFVAQCNPQASQAVQHNAALRIGNELNGAVAFGCFAPWI
jgi:hypothetical protein